MNGHSCWGNFTVLETLIASSKPTAVILETAYLMAAEWWEIYIIKVKLFMLNKHILQWILFVLVKLTAILIDDIRT